MREIFSIVLLAATITTSHAAVIKGTVTDTSNGPLIGATVRIENTTYTATAAKEILAS